MEGPPPPERTPAAGCDRVRNSVRNGIEVDGER